MVLPHYPCDSSNKGKLLRNYGISAADVIEWDLMPKLEQVPRTPRTKYGRRNQLSEAERAELNRQRNREHSQATRIRRKIFEEILEIRDSKLQRHCSIEPSLKNVL